MNQFLFFIEKKSLTINSIFVFPAFFNNAIYSKKNIVVMKNFKFIFFNLLVQVFLGFQIYGQSELITFPDLGSEFHFGYDMDVSVDAMIVGAPGLSNSIYNRLYFLKKNTNGWEIQNTFTSTTGNLGRSVAIDGDFAIASDSPINNGPSIGKVYIYKKNGSDWELYQTVEPSDSNIPSLFGYSIAMSGDYFVVGAISHGGGGSSGAAYVFHLENDVWVEQTRIEASDDIAGNQFGWSVDIDNNVIVVGSRAQEEPNNYGAAYVYRLSGITWEEEAKLTTSDGIKARRFGNDVGIDGNTVVVLSGSTQNIFTTDAKAYFFGYNGNTWNEVQILDSPAPDNLHGNRDIFLDADRFILGTGDHSSFITGLFPDPPNSSGYVASYIRENGMWQLDTVLIADDPQEGARMGGSIAFENNKIYAGAASFDGFGNINSGAVYSLPLEPIVTIVDCQSIDITNQGFTLLGEYNGHKYFISNENAKPVDAQLVAAQNGGYLAVINDQTENDFLQHNISELAYIGLTDVQVEGSFEWDNGDAFTFDNINPCSSCSENGDELDYLVIVPWDGEWTFSSIWSSRKYIVEIPCSIATPTNMLCTDTNNNTFAEQYEDFPDSLDIRDVVESPDCGYFLAAEDGHNGFLIYVNNNGEYQWQTEIPNAIVSKLDIFPNQDGFLLIGKNIENDNKPFAIKYNNEGEEIWNYTYDSLEANYFVGDPVFLDDGSILLLSSNDRVIKLDELGVFQWEEYPFPDTNNGAVGKSIYNMHLLDNGELLFFVNEIDQFGFSWNSSPNDIYFAKTDIDLQPISYELTLSCCSGGSYRYFNASTKAADGSIHLLITERDQGPFYSTTEIKQYKIDSVGNLEYQYWVAPCSLPTSQLGTGGKDIAVTSAGNVLIAGTICTETYPGSSGNHPAPLCGESVPLTISAANDCLETVDFFANQSGSAKGEKVLETLEDGILLLGRFGGSYFLVKTDENGDLFASPTSNNSFTNELPQNPETLFQDKKELSIENVFPNPASNFIVAKINSPAEQEMTLQVFDARGVLLKMVDVELYEGMNKIEVSISDLPDGFYFMKIPQTDGQPISKRFVKVKN